MAQKLPNIHPGQVLLEEFMIPHKLTQNRLAKDLVVSPRRINEIVQGKRSITADTALRLSCYFGTSAQFWMGLQDDFELEEAKIQLEPIHIKPFSHPDNQPAFLTV
ncbi:MAG: HigA family addiction module antitoxin [Alphaproteobacteria bacterium]|nr:HigA family addiction module antitoxin [Alphaproteobacteria bacterium]